MNGRKKRRVKDVTLLIRTDAPVGAMDSGVGGLTVVQNLRRILPGEDVLFFGDSVNCPYGNRSEDEIFELGMNMIRGFEREGVKCVVIACNTISSVADRFRRETDLQLFSIVESAAKYVAGMGAKSAGLIATERVVNSGIFERSLRSEIPDFRLTAQGSRRLAALIDSGLTEGAEIETEIRACVDKIIAAGERDRLILGCTHYPIVADTFQRCYPELTLIDAACAQAQAVSDWLSENALLRTGHEGTLTVRTSGSRDTFDRVCSLLGISEGTRIQTVESL